MPLTKLASKLKKQQLIEHLKYLCERHYQWHNAWQVVDSGGFSTMFSIHACYWKFWETWELAFLIEMLLFQWLYTWPGTGLKNVPLLSPIFLEIEPDLNKDPHSWMESLISLWCEIQAEAHGKRGQFGIPAQPLGQRSERRQPCALLCADSWWPRHQRQQCFGTHRKTGPRRHGSTSRGTGRHQEVALQGWRQMLLRALQWQLLQTQSPSVTAPSASTSISWRPKATRASQPIRKGNN